MNVTLRGQFTHFVQGTTTASFGAGITVATLTVSSATTAAAVLNIDAAAATGSRDVTMTTGGEVVTLSNGFAVTAGAPALQNPDRASGQKGQQKKKKTRGQITHLFQGDAAAG